MSDAELDGHTDPIVRNFLSFVEKEMVNNPSTITPVSADQMARIATLTDGMIVTDKDDLG